LGETAELAKPARAESIKKRPNHEDSAAVMLLSRFTSGTNLRFGIWVGRVDEKLAAVVAMLPIVTEGNIKGATVIIADATLSMFIRRSLLSFLLPFETASVFVEFFLLFQNGPLRFRCKFGLELGIHSGVFCVHDNLLKREQGLICS
jgi:hypothetical protein